MWRSAAALVLGLATAGSAGAGEPDCVALASGADLQDAVTKAPAGASLCLAPGDYAGPVRIDKSLTLEGPRDAVIRSRGQGSTVTLGAPGATLLGLTIDGSGGRFDLLDAAVHVEADDVRVEGIAVRNALFGLLAERANRVALVDNDITGSPGKALGMRGDSIRIWEVRESTIARNRVADGRDLVVWYSPGNRIVGNTVLRGRYGTHLMYSHDNVIEDNHYEGNVVGIFAMYSRNVAIRRNVIARSKGAAGVGLGSKESGSLRVEDNAFVGNHIGVYLDTSPLYVDDLNQFTGNRFHMSDAAVVFHGGAHRNRFRDNAFRSNGVPVRVEGRGDALDAVWHGNDFDDYAGYDLDGDGVGDLPYELRSLADDLVGREPGLAFFRGSPALALVELIGRVVPLFRAKTLLVDPEPRVGPLKLGSRKGTLADAG